MKTLPNSITLHGWVCISLLIYCTITEDNTIFNLTKWQYTHHIVLEVLIIDPQNTDNEMLANLIDLVAKKRRMDAINLVQEIFDTGPTKAVVAVDKMLEGEPLNSALSDFLPNKSSLPDSTDTIVYAGLLANNKKIEAIKLYRDIHDVGLKEAKDAIDYFQISGQFPNSLQIHQPDKTELNKIEDLISKRQILEAIKLYRQVYNVDLKQAKEAVDAIIRGNRLPKTGFLPPQTIQKNSTIVRYFITLLIIGLGVLMVLAIGSP